jgi:ATP-dependent Zn protease
MDMDRLHTAHHEAGHAVIGRVLGLTCGLATIVPDYEERTAGLAQTFVERSISDWEARGRNRRDPMFRAGIMTLMAGREAEIECLGKDQGGDGDDQYQIDEMMREPDATKRDDGGHYDATVLMVKLRAQTRALVRRHRIVIEQVAKSLVDRRTLEPEEIDAIVRQAGVRLACRIDAASVSSEDKSANMRAWSQCSKISRARVE